MLTQSLIVKLCW